MAAAELGHHGEEQQSKRLLSVHGETWGRREQDQGQGWGRDRSGMGQGWGRDGASPSQHHRGSSMGHRELWGSLSSILKVSLQVCHSGGSVSCSTRMFSTIRYMTLSRTLPGQQSTQVCVCLSVLSPGTVPSQRRGYLSSVLSAREMAGFRRALLQAWLFLRDRGQVRACSLRNGWEWHRGDGTPGTPPEEEEGKEHGEEREED